MLPGQTIVGACVSRTVTRWVQTAWLPHRSVTVQVTVVVPGGNCAGALLVSTSPPQPGEVIVGVPRLSPEAKHTPALALFVMSGGQTSCGGAATTTTVCRQKFV